jgi:chromosome segregation ATPase
MQMKSGASLQGAVFSEVKELLSLIGDSKKAKEQVELLAQDIASFKELYEKNQVEVGKLDKIKSEIDLDKSVLESEKSKLKEEKEISEKVKSILEQTRKDLDTGFKKLDIDKFEFSAQIEKEKNEIEEKAFKSAKLFQEASEMKKQADALISEYEEKLAKLKAMVG